MIAAGAQPFFLLLFFKGPKAESLVLRDRDDVLKRAIRERDGASVHGNCEKSQREKDGASVHGNYEIAEKKKT